MSDPRYTALLAARASRPDPAVTGVSEPVEVRVDVLLPLPGRDVRVRLYRAVAAGVPAPLLLWLHGGAFVGGTLDDIDVACAGLAVRTGATVVSLDYRLAPEHPFPAALDDTYDSLAWLAAHGAVHGSVFGGDGRLLAGGQSAGANLVASACLLARDRGGPRVDHQILVYPWLDFGRDSESHRLFDATADDDWYVAQYTADQVPTPLMAPLLARDLSGLPPALVLGAGRDAVRDDARRYAARLGDTASYVEYADAPHAFLNFPGAQPVAWRALDDIADYVGRSIR
jgi:acetyl esterase